MELKPISRTPSLFMNEVKEPNAFEGGHRSSRNQAERIARGRKAGRVILVRHAARVGNLNDHRCRRISGVPEHHVPVTIILYDDLGNLSAHAIDAKLVRRQPSGLRVRHLRYRELVQRRDRGFDHAAINCRRIRVGEHLHRPTIDSAPGLMLGPWFSRFSRSKSTERNECR